MIQLSKPRRALAKPTDAFKRHEVNARDLLGNGYGDGDKRSGTPSRFDASFYRTHDQLGYIPPDAQSLKSQATYSSGLPLYSGMNGPFGGMQRSSNGIKRSAYGSYASSVISQDAGGDGSSIAPTTSGAGSVAYSQADRLQRRLSYSSSVAGTSDLLSGSQYDYKSSIDDASDMDDMKSQYAPTTSGITSF
jgi:regulator of nonsense transcripts 1